MNICFLRARTNIQIGSENPLAYFAEFGGVPEFDRILRSHLIPSEFIERERFSPEDYRAFLYARADRFAHQLRARLPTVKMDIVD